MGSRDPLTKNGGRDGVYLDGWVPGSDPGEKYELCGESPQTQKKTESLSRTKLKGGSEGRRVMVQTVTYKIAFYDRWERLDDPQILLWLDP